MSLTDVSLPILSSCHTSLDQMIGLCKATDKGPRLIHLFFLRDRNNCERFPTRKTKFTLLPKITWLSWFFKKKGKKSSPSSLPITDSNWQAGMLCSDPLTRSVKLAWHHSGPLWTIRTTCWEPFTLLPQRGALTCISCANSSQGQKGVDN